MDNKESGLWTPPLPVPTFVPHGPRAPPLMWAQMCLPMRDPQGQSLTEVQIHCYDSETLFVRVSGGYRYLCTLYEQGQ